MLSRRNWLKVIWFVVLCVAGLPLMVADSVAGASDDESAAKSLAALHPIDAHVHVFKDDAGLGALLRRFDMHLLDILVVDDRDKFENQLEPQRSDALAVRRVYPGRVALCTTISPYDFEQPGFAERVKRQLDGDFAAGAVAVKIYKVLGMEIKTKQGKYLLPDDPVLDPIYEEIAAKGRTVVAHVAEPDSCWQAPNPASPDYGYYKDNPGEYAYLHPEWPSKAEILKARDHVLEKHPKLRVVGAHLGSMEVDVDEIAKRFDRYPNFAVDTAARVVYLTLQPREKVRAFLIKYQDRVLYGTDFELGPTADAGKELSWANATYLLDWKYFSTNEVVTYQGREVKGLGLPPQVLRKLYHENAVRWIPGILDAGK